MAASTIFDETPLEGMQRAVKHYQLYQNGYLLGLLEAVSCAHGDRVQIDLPRIAWIMSQSVS